MEKDRILEQAVAHPKACTRVIRRLLGTTEGIFQLACATEAIGVAYAHHLFEGLTTTQWATIQKLAIHQLPDVPNESKKQAMQEFSENIRKEAVFCSAPHHDEDPFEFLKGLSQDLLAEALKGQEPSKIAIIADYWSADEMNSILLAVAPPQRREVVLYLSRLGRIPKAVLHALAKDFAESLQTWLQTKQQPSMADIEALLAEEENLLNFIAKTSPELHAKLKPFSSSAAFSVATIQEAEGSAKVPEGMPPYPKLQAEP